MFQRKAKGRYSLFLSKAIIKVRVFKLEQEQCEELTVGQHLDNVPNDMADPGQLKKGARLSVCREEKGQRHCWA